MNIFSDDERFQLVVRLVRRIPLGALAEMGLSIESLGFFENNPQVGLRALTEKAGDDLPTYFRKIKREYADSVNKAIVKVLAEKSCREGALLKILYRSLLDIDVSQLFDLEIGLSVGLVVGASIPETLKKMFVLDDASGNYVPRPEFKEQLISVVSELIYTDPRF